MPSFGWIKNPLSIIAIFISLIYAIASLLFGLSVKNLTPENQTVLVWFVVIFPLIVLGVFTWLVAKHHHKLYGPADFRNDDAFIRTLPTAAPVDVAKKHEDEVKQIEDNATQAPPKLLLQSLKGRGAAYVLETLALQELQSFIDGSFRRELQLADRMIVDGIFENPASITFVEIKTLTVNWYLFTALQQASRVLSAARRQALQQAVQKQVITMAILVVDDHIAEEEMQKQAERLPIDERPNLIRQFVKNELLAKYGYPT
jgi:hypothetical protein